MDTHDNKRKNKRLFTRRGGFTLLEVIVVIGLAGLFAAVALTRFELVTEDVAGEATRFRTALRFAQSLGFAQAYVGSNTSVTWGLNVDSGSYTLVRDGNAQSDVSLPGESADDYDLPDGISITTGTISFDFRGIPCDAGGTALTSNTNYTLTAAGHHDSATETVTVTQGTGLVQ